MDIEALTAYCLSKPQTSSDLPFGEDILVFRVVGKIFALLSLTAWEAGKPAINLKCNPEKAVLLRQEYSAISPGYHMNKKHWNTVKIDSNQIKETFLKEMIDHSYQCVVEKLPRKQRQAFEI